MEFYEDAESVPCLDEGPFVRVPFLRKDISSIEAGLLYECGSPLYQGFRPAVNSYFVERVRAGACAL